MPRSCEYNAKKYDDRAQSDAEVRRRGGNGGRERETEEDRVNSTATGYTADGRGTTLHGTGYVD